ncbi:MAG: hypothetical protein GY850_20890 [bacterium]|nr:hypothetical protein [bacterium]
MAAVGFITSREAQNAFQAELKLQPRGADSRTGSYFLDVVLNTLEKRYGPEVVYHGGLKVFVDKKVTIPVKGAPDWSPRNFSRSYDGPMILKRAMMKSSNSVAAQLVERCGPQAVVETARRCGIESSLKSFYSVALGTFGVSPLEMASSFATFATGGIHLGGFYDPGHRW